MKIVLASASVARAALLKNAGVDVLCGPADIDESVLKKMLKGSTEELAVALAEQKASHVSKRHPGALVIGADQILECAGQRFDKVATMEEARQKLLLLRGRAHALVTAIAVVRDGEILWRHVEAPNLVMRDFSNEFLDHYIATAGSEILGAVGCYLLEDAGIQLIEEIEGDYFSILGLPLLPLLGYLRNQGALQK